jgi:cytochrome c5
MRLLSVCVAVLGLLAACGSSTTTTTTSSSVTDGGAETASGGVDAVADSSTGADSATAPDTASEADAAAAADANPVQDATAPAKVSWSSVSAIISTKCGNCHSGFLFFKATDCASTVKQGKKLAQEVQMNTMPPKGQPQLTADEKAAVLKWAEDGFACD